MIVQEGGGPLYSSVRGYQDPRTTLYRAYNITPCLQFAVPNLPKIDQSYGLQIIVDLRSQITDCRSFDDNNDNDHQTQLDQQEEEVLTSYACWAMCFQGKQINGPCTSTNEDNDDNQ